jgi:glycosyltransferase involved in cell wall biosynthesis
MTAPIIHIGPTPFFSNRGCHIRILNEICGVTGTGRKVVLCTYGLGGDIEGIDVRRIWSIPGYTKTQAGFSFFKPLADILLFFLVLKVVWQEKARVIHGHLHEGGLIGWCVKILLFWRKIAVIMDIQGSLSGELRSYGTFKKLPFILSFFYFLERIICLMPDRIVCSSEASRDFLKRSCKVDQRKLELVGDVVPASFFSSEGDGARRIQLGLPPDKQVVIYTGSLLPGKGVDLLVEAMEQVLNIRDDTVFVLVGYPIKDIKEELDLAGLTDRVIMPGEVDYSDLSKWLAGADLAVDPKPSGSGEASGKVLHYMAAGRAVVCFGTENNRVFLGEYGFFATAESSSDLAAAIDLALTDPEARRKYGAFCRSRAERDFSSDTAGQQLHRLYQQYEK